MSQDHQRVRLVIADDHPIVLEGIAKVLEAESDFEVCAKCSNGSDALRAIREHRPDVAVLDIVMPDMTGLDALTQINAEGLDTKAVFLTANATDAYILALIENGARGLLMKDTGVGELSLCIRKVAGGGRHFPNDIVAAAIERETGRRTTGEQFQRALSARERVIALQVAEGLSNKAVARRLNLSEGTVRIHVHNIYQKTGIGSRGALTALILAHRDLLRS
jgi:two-component system nitrate/nitrite response regulator NarL